MEKVKGNVEVSNMQKRLKSNKIKAVPYDKGCGFALMAEKGMMIGFLKY